MKKISFLFTVFCAALLSGAQVKVDPAKAVIVADPKADSVVRFAAQELQANLRLATGKTIPITAKREPGKYAFVFGTPAGVKLKPEEAVWEVTPTETRLYGDSDKAGPRLIPEKVLRTGRTGDLTAVYLFLEKQLGFLFLAPGPLGVSFPETPVLTLTTGRGSWDPGRLIMRSLRWDYGRFRHGSQHGKLPEFYAKRVKSDYEQRDLDTRRWLKQMRMGHSISYYYAHAFTQWWKLYGKTHPEYFALHKGKRAPWGDPADIKMCVSNPGFVKQIVENWKKRKPRPASINACENDCGNYCECAECRKLDTPPAPGARWDEHLTDRYIHFANEVLRTARKIDPKVVVAFYAYAAYRAPPKRERVEPGIFIGFVPSMMNYPEVDREYKAWREMGADLIFQRPNDMHINTGLPMGIEEILFKHFQVGVKNGIIGTDYDSLHRFWETTGIADYILARGHSDPSKSFEYWLDEYCSAFGAAAPEVKEYYTYFRREIFDKRLYPNRKAIASKGRYGNFRRGLMWDLPKYYKEKDFDVTDAILKKGLAKKLTPQQRARLERLLKANLHARLTFRAVAAKGDKKLAAAKVLHKFRMDNWDKLNMSWFNLFQIESEFGDVAGISLAERMKDYSAGFALPLIWHFTPDPQKKGDAEKIWNTSPGEMSWTWDRIRVDAAWENQPASIDPRLRKFMKNYDGIGWYGLGLKIPASWKGREIHLLFGAVDESAWVYLNGKPCGSHVYKLRDDWQTPFSIRIDPAVDWSKKEQSLVVKVEDKSGLGGIWRPVMLAVK